MSISRDNHYVPQMYLRNWDAGDIDKVYVYRLLVPDENVPVWKLCQIKTTAYIKNLYVRAEGNHEVDDFEINFNQQFETPAKPSLEKALHGDRMTPDDWRSISEYILSQYFRTPAFFFQVQDWGINSIQEILQSELDRFSKLVNEGNDIPRVQQHADNSLLPFKMEIVRQDKASAKTELEVSTVVGKNLWLHTIETQLSPGSLVYKIFQAMKWKIVTAADGVIWPTCDNPVVAFNILSGEQCYIGKQGIWGKDVMIIFPISPQKAIIGTEIHVFSHHFTADMDFSLKIKSAIIRNAFLYIYSSFEDPDIEKIRKRVVDLESFVHIQNEFISWYNKYQSTEAPYLGKDRAIIKK